MFDPKTESFIETIILKNEENGLYAAHEVHIWPVDRADLNSEILDNLLETAVENTLFAAEKSVRYDRDEYASIYAEVSASDYDEMPF